MYTWLNYVNLQRHHTGMGHAVHTVSEVREVTNIGPWVSIGVPVDMEHLIIEKHL